MSSFTFSSKRFICLSVSIGIVMVVCYQAWIFKKLPSGGEAQNQFQDNIARAQHYIYNSTQFPVVVVGSSMSVRIPFHEFHETLYNLSLSGNGPLTGLSILKQSKASPRIVFIEISESWLRKPDEPFLRSLFHPGTRWLIKKVPILEDSYQPVSILDFFIRKKFSKKTVLEEKNSEPFQAAFEQQLHEYEQVPKPTELQETCKEFSLLTTELAKHGSKIVFFEPPVHERLMHSKKLSIIREFSHTCFPETTYEWIPPFQAQAFQTTDGIHLQEQSARKFAQLFVDSFLASFTFLPSTKRK